MQLFCICSVPVKEVSFSNAAGLQHAILLKNVHRHKYFSKVSTPQVGEQLCCTTRSTSMATSGIYLFIYLFTTLFNVGHAILTRLIKTNLTKNHNRNLRHAKQEQ